MADDTGNPFAGLFGSWGYNPNTGSAIDAAGRTFGIQKAPMPSPLVGIGGMLSNLGAAVNVPDVVTGPAQAYYSAANDATRTNNLPGLTVLQQQAAAQADVWKTAKLAELTRQLAARDQAAAAGNGVGATNAPAGTIAAPGTNAAATAQPYGAAPATGTGAAPVLNIPALTPAPGASTGNASSNPLAPNALSRFDPNDPADAAVMKQAAVADITNPGEGARIRAEWLSGGKAKALEDRLNLNQDLQYYNWMNGGGAGSPTGVGIMGNAPAAGGVNVPTSSVDWSSGRPGPTVQRSPAPAPVGSQAEGTTGVDQPTLLDRINSISQQMGIDPQHLSKQTMAALWADRRTGGKNVQQILARDPSVMVQGELAKKVADQAASMAENQQSADRMRSVADELDKRLDFYKANKPQDLANALGSFNDRGPGGEESTYLKDQSNMFNQLPWYMGATPNPLRGPMNWLAQNLEKGKHWDVGTYKDAYDVYNDLSHVSHMVPSLARGARGTSTGTDKAQGIIDDMISKALSAKDYDSAKQIIQEFRETYLPALGNTGPSTMARPGTAPGTAPGTNPGGDYTWDPKNGLRPSQ